MNDQTPELPRRILMGPGPSDVPDRVLRAMAVPTIGHLDPVFLQVMDETRGLMRDVFQTQNELTLAVSGTGSAGMESAICNLVEPGDERQPQLTGRRTQQEQIGIDRVVDAEDGQLVRPAAAGIEHVDQRVGILADQEHFIEIGSVLAVERDRRVDSVRGELIILGGQGRCGAPVLRDVDVEVDQVSAAAAEDKR